MSLTDEVIWGEKQTNKQTAGEKDRENRTEEGKTQRGGKTPQRPASKGSHGVPGECHPLDMSPVVMEVGGDDEEDEEEFSPHPKCFTETHSNSLWIAPAYDAVSTDQSTLIRCKHYTLTFVILYIKLLSTYIIGYCLLSIWITIIYFVVQSVWFL